MQFRLLTAVLAVTQAVTLEDKVDPDKEHIDFPKNTDLVLERLDEIFGNSKYTPDPLEAGEGTFEHRLNNLTDDFYDKAGHEFGDRVYGKFYEHGGAYDVDFDYGLDPHGVPVYEHNHFSYNQGSYGNPWADKFEPHYIEVHYPEEQAYSFQVEPTIQYTRIEHQAPPEYVRPHENFDHVDHEGYFNEREDFYIEDYLGSPGSDHSHFDYDNTETEFHNHHLYDPYAVERLYQPPADAYFIPVVVDPIPTYVPPYDDYYGEDYYGEQAYGGTYGDELIVAPYEESYIDYQIPLDLDYYLNDSYYIEPYYEEEYAGDYSGDYGSGAYGDYNDSYRLEPIYDDLDFLFEHVPHVPNSYDHNHG